MFYCSLRRVTLTAPLTFLTHTHKNLHTFTQTHTQIDTKQHNRTSPPHPARGRQVKHRQPIAAKYFYRDVIKSSDHCSDIREMFWSRWHQTTQECHVKSYLSKTAVWLPFSKTHHPQWRLTGQQWRPVVVLGGCQAHNVPQCFTNNKSATNKSQWECQTWTEYRVT